MSTPLRVELNGEAVHAVDAPAEFAASGPFFVELRNAGGPVHVHLHLDDDLSRAARLDGGNHYVEGGSTKRVPIGVVPDAGRVTGRLKVVSGYGTETAYVTVTVDPDAASASGADAASASGTDAASGTASAAPASRAGASDASGGAGVADGVASSGGDSGTPSPRRGGGKRTPRGGRATGSPIGAGASIESAVGGAVGTLREAVSAFGRVVGGASRGDAAFLALGGAALVVGLAVMAAARDAALNAVVAAVVLGVLSTVAWLLRG